MPSSRSTPQFPVRRLPDGRQCLNLGSGSRAAPDWNNVDFGWMIRLSKHPIASGALRRVGLISDERWGRLRKLDPHGICWDLSRGIPFDDDTFDCVYHSHMFEHLDREVAPEFLVECRRVLKPGGIIRIVVPDLEQLARAYVSILDGPLDAASVPKYREVLDEIFDQMVRKRPKVRDGQPIANRVIETLVVGDTARSGVLHRWMYDRFSLRLLLADTGFEDFQHRSPTTSGIDGWTGFHLDTDPDGSVYKGWSVYVEASKPRRRP